MAITPRILQHVNKVSAHYHCLCVVWITFTSLNKYNCVRHFLRSILFHITMFIVLIHKMVFFDMLWAPSQYQEISAPYWSGSRSSWGGPLCNNLFKWLPVLVEWVSRSGWGASILLCMSRGLEVSGCCLNISCQPHRQPSRGRRRRGEGWQRTAPRRAAPFTGDVWPILRQRETIQPVSGLRNGFD